MRGAYKLEVYCQKFIAMQSQINELCEWYFTSVYCIQHVLTFPQYLTQSNYLDTYIAYFNNLCPDYWKCCQLAKYPTQIVVLY